MLNLSQLMRLWYLSHRWPAKVQESICTVSPELLLFAHMKYGSRQTKNQTPSPSGWLHMRVWRMSLRRTKSTIISWHGLFFFYNTYPSSTVQSLSQRPIFLGENQYLSLIQWYHGGSHLLWSPGFHVHVLPASDTEIRHTTNILKLGASEFTAEDLNS